MFMLNDCLSFSYNVASLSLKCIQSHSSVVECFVNKLCEFHQFVFSTMLFIFAFLRISSSLATFGFVSYPWLHFNTFGYCNGNNYWIMMHFTRARKGSQRGREGLVCLMQAMLLWKTRICSQGRLKQNKVKRLVYFWKYKFDESMAIYMYFVCLHANKIQGKQITMFTCLTILLPYTTNKMLKQLNGLQSPNWIFTFSWYLPHFIILPLTMII